MLLKEAFHLERSDQIAFVGAGGKTTAMFKLAREAGVPVLVTTSTHLGRNQADLADQHIITIDETQLTEYLKEVPQGITLITGPVDQETWLSGVSMSMLDYLSGFAARNQIPLFIEADGSRCRPLKAPAGHEPAIPGFVNKVVVVAGLSGLGLPCAEPYVHRPDVFRQLSGLKTGDPITPHSLTTVLLHGQGGIKNIPSGALKISLLNQADSGSSINTAQIMIN